VTGPQFWWLFEYFVFRGVYPRIFPKYVLNISEGIPKHHTNKYFWQFTRLTECSGSAQCNTNNNENV
jgi:hypothetical protein